MQPLILAEQTRQKIADFLSTTFPATTHSFDAITKRFLAGAGNLAKGPYITIALPFVTLAMVHLCRVVYSLNRVSFFGGQDQIDRAGGLAGSRDAC